MGQIASNLSGDDLNKILALLLGQTPPSQPAGLFPSRMGAAPKQPNPTADARQKLNLVNRVLYGNKQGMGLQMGTSPDSYFANKESFDSIGARTARDFVVPGNVKR